MKKEKEAELEANKAILAELEAAQIAILAELEAKKAELEAEEARLATAEVEVEGVEGAIFVIPQRF